MPVSRSRPPLFAAGGCSRLCLAALLLLLAACTPALTRQASTVQPEGGFSASGEAPLAEQWWLAFEDPALSRLIERALAGNLTLQSAWDRLDRAAAAARKAGAELFPQVGAEAGFSSTSARTNGRTEATQNFSLGLAASYELDLWGRLGSVREAAELDALASAEDLQAAALTLSARVASTWYQWLEQHGQRELLEQQLQTNQQTLELINLQFRAGLVGIADLLQQRQVVENRHGELALTAGRAQVLQNQLAILLGVPPAQFPATATAIGTLGELPDLPATGLQSSLIERRPDVRAAWLQVLAADRRVASAAADRLPRLSLSGRASTAGEQLEELFDDWLASLTASLIAPLIDGGRRRAEVERSQTVAAEALHGYGQTVLEALREVEDALTLEQRLREYLASIDRQLELATQATGRIRDRYLNGAVDYQRVLLSLLSEQQLQRTRLAARRELLENRVNLCRALAGGWQLVRNDLQVTSTGE